MLCETLPRTLRQLCAATLSACLLAAFANACDTPVYRYAMYRWQSTPFELYCFHQGEDELSEQVTAIEKLVQEAQERIENPNDKRSRLVRLLPDGDRVARKISAELLATNQRLIGDILTEDESELLAELLMKLRAGLEKRNA